MRASPNDRRRGPAEATAPAVVSQPAWQILTALIFGPSLLLGFWIVWRRNLLVTVVAHFLYDVKALILPNRYEI